MTFSMAPIADVDDGYYNTDGNKNFKYGSDSLKIRIGIALELLSATFIRLMSKSLAEKVLG